jgi:hypothetical protein
VVWLAWLQLPVIFKYRLVTVLVPLASDSRILSIIYTNSSVLYEWFIGENFRYRKCISYCTNS